MSTNPEFLTYPDENKDAPVAKVIEHFLSIKPEAHKDKKALLDLLRDRALIFLLADTGVSIQTARKLRWRDFDYKTGHLSVRDQDGGGITITLSPGPAYALIRYKYSRLKHFRKYRSRWPWLPIFVRHEAEPYHNGPHLTEEDLRALIAQRSVEALGEEAGGMITPTSLRQHFHEFLVRSIGKSHPSIAEQCQMYFETGRYDDAFFFAMGTLIIAFKKWRGYADVPEEVEIVRPHLIINHFVAIEAFDYTKAISIALYEMDKLMWDERRKSRG